MLISAGLLLILIAIGLGMVAIDEHNIGDEAIPLSRDGQPSMRERPNGRPWGIASATTGGVGFALLGTGLVVRRRSARPRPR